MVWVASLLLSSQVLQGYFLSLMGNCIVWTVNCLMNVTSSAAGLLSLSIIVSKLEKVTHHWLSVVLWPALHCTGNWCRNAGPGGGGVMPHTALWANHLKGWCFFWNWPLSGLQGVEVCAGLLQSVPMGAAECVQGYRYRVCAGCSFNILPCSSRLNQKIFYFIEKKNIFYMNVY